MSRHEGKPAQKSPATREIARDNGVLDDKDIEQAIGGLSLNYTHIKFEYVER
jgi:hypothetical protein